MLTDEIKRQIDTYASHSTLSREEQDTLLPYLTFICDAATKLDELELQLQALQVIKLLLKSPALTDDQVKLIKRKLFQQLIGLLPEVPSEDLTEQQKLAHGVLSYLLPRRLTLNTEKCYVIPETMLLDLEKCLEGVIVREDWLNDLKQKYLNANQSDLTQHIGPTATYSKKAELTQLLKIIYARLEGLLDEKYKPLTDDQRTALHAKLTEGIKNCSEGYHDRVKYAVDNMSMPQTLVEHLYKIRMEIADNVARTITNEVHTHNFIFRIFQAYGFGVMPPHAADVYGDVYGTINDATEKYLITNFHARYNPYAIYYKLLFEQIRANIYSLGYHGKIIVKPEDKHAYLQTVRDYFIDYLKIVLKLESLTYRELLEKFFIRDIRPLPADEALPEDEDERLYNEIDRTRYVDINWDFVQQRLREVLLEDVLISPALPPSKPAFLQHLFALLVERLEHCEDACVLKEILDNDYLNRDDWKTLLTTHNAEGHSVLQILTDHAPLENFISIWDITKSVLTTEQLKTRLLSEDLLLIAAKFNHKVIPLLFEFINSLDDPEYKAQLLTKKLHGQNILMLAIRYQPQALPYVLEEIKKLPNAEQRKFFEARDENNMHALSYAARYNAESLSLLLSHTRRLFTNDDVINIITGYGSSSPLAIATCYNASALQPLLTELKSVDKKNEVLSCLLALSGGNNLLLKAIRHQPRAVAILLNASKTLGLISRRHMHYAYDAERLNTLRIAIKQQSEAVQYLLDDVCTFGDDGETLSQVLTSGMDENSILNRALDYYPAAIQQIFAAIESVDMRAARKENLRTELFKPSSTNGSTLVLSLNHDNVYILEMLLCEIKKISNPVTQRKILLQKDSATNGTALKLALIHNKHQHLEKFVKHLSDQQLIEMIADKPLEKLNIDDINQAATALSSIAEIKQARKFTMARILLNRYAAYCSAIRSSIAHRWFGQNPTIAHQYREVLTVLGDNFKLENFRELTNAPLLSIGSLAFNSESASTIVAQPSQETPVQSL